MRRFRRSWARTLLDLTDPAQPVSGKRALAEVGLAAGAYLAYFLVRGRVDQGKHARARRNGAAIITAEQRLGIFVEPAVQRWVVPREAAWRTMNFVYFWGDFPLIVGSGIAMLVTGRRRSYALLRDSTLASGGIALVMYATWPVAPPRYFPEHGFVDTLAEFSQLSYQAQNLGPFVNPYAAMPSLHVGWSLLFSIVVYRATEHRLVRGAAFTVTGLQWAAVVGTGNHFILDGVAGVAVSLAGLRLAEWLERAGYPAGRSWLATRVVRS